MEMTERFFSVPGQFTDCMSFDYTIFEMYNQIITLFLFTYLLLLKAVWKL